MYALMIPRVSVVAVDDDAEAVTTVNHIAFQRPKIRTTVNVLLF